MFYFIGVHDYFVILPRSGIQKFSTIGRLSIVELILYFLCHPLRGFNMYTMISFASGVYTPAGVIPICRGTPACDVTVLRTCGTNKTMCTSSIITAKKYGGIANSSNNCGVKIKKPSLLATAFFIIKKISCVLLICCVANKTNSVTVEFVFGIYGCETLVCIYTLKTINSERICMFRSISKSNTIVTHNIGV